VPADAAGVVVDAEEVDRLADQHEVALGPGGPGVAEDLGHLVGVAPEGCGFEVLAVHVGVDPVGRGEIRGILRGRRLGLEVEDDADLVAADRAIHLHRGPVREHHMVRGDRRLEPVAVTGRERAMQIAAVGDHPGLVQCRPPGHAIVEVRGKLATWIEARHKWAEMRGFLAHNVRTITSSRNGCDAVQPTLLKK